MKQLSKINFYFHPRSNGPVNTSSTNIVDFDGFIADFMNQESDSYAFSKDPIQIHPLSIAASLIPTPTPLFRARYNFLLLFTQGGGTQQVDTETVDLKPNDLLFIREGHLNAVTTIEPDTKGYYIHMESPVLASIFEDSALLRRLTFNPKQSVSSEMMKWLSNCAALMKEAGDQLESSEGVRLALLRAMLLAITQQASEDWQNRDRRWQITMHFKEMVYEHATEQRRVSFYADRLAVSRNYLNRCVSDVTDQSPKHHINEAVLTQSKIMLQNPKNNISEIAYQLGFSDPSYFGRLFKQFTNYTPSQYRSSFLHGLSE